MGHPLSAALRHLRAQDRSERVWMVMRMLRPLARFFETTPEFWMNLQRSFDLRTAEIDAGSKIAHDVQPMTTHP